MVISNMPDVIFNGTKSVEAIDHIRSKMRIPTEHWDDMLGEVHAKAFTVAGATKTALLSDLHSAVGDAIENGQSIGQFRKAFDKAVQDHGWQYKGERGWRTRVIYDTNMRTAHMAGRWDQIQRTKKLRPYLIYMTVGDQRVRDEHRKWHAMALPVDDAWWNTHYPPNDFGCRCYVIQASAADLKRRGIEVHNAPPENPTRRINTSTGEDFGDVPEGVAVGWNYNVGKAWLGPDIAFGKTIAKLPAPLQSQVLQQVAYKPIDDAFATWAKQALGDGVKRSKTGTQYAAGFIQSDVIQALSAKYNIDIAGAALKVEERQLIRMQRDAKVDALDNSTIENLSVLLRNPLSVYLDRDKKNLIYVLPVSPDNDKDKLAKVVVNIDFKAEGLPISSIRSARFSTKRDLTSGLFLDLINPLKK
jgi:SPP1 gp7 family putative phage head morphogenesis protein